jgi:hypothetical protein
LGKALTNSTVWEVAAANFRPALIIKVIIHELMIPSNLLLQTFVQWRMGQGTRQLVMMGKMQLQTSFSVFSSLRGSRRNGSNVFV